MADESQTPSPEGEDGAEGQPETTGQPLPQDDAPREEESSVEELLSELSAEPEEPSEEPTEEPEQPPEGPEEPEETAEREQDEEGGPDQAPAAEEGDEPEEEEPGDEAPEDEAKEQEAEEETETPEGEEEQVVPPELHLVRLPLIGGVPLWGLGAALAASVALFVAVLAVGLFMWRRQPAPAAPAGTEAAAQAEADQDAPPRRRIAPRVLAALSYDELLGRGEEAMVQKQYAAAAQLHREAASRGDEGIARVLLARHRLSRALLELGRAKEALRLADSLRSVSRPGDELWKHSLIVSVRLLGRQRRWGEFFQHLYLLRSNTARYPDEQALNRWLAYKEAMAAVTRYLELNPPARTLYDMEAPPFGRADCRCRPLNESDIVVVTGKYGDGSLEVRHQQGEVRLLSEGASLERVLASLGREADLDIRLAGPAHYPVSACLEAVTPEQALQMVVGSLGMEARAEDQTYRVLARQPDATSAAQALEKALWSAQEFLILHPESANVPEAYYALGHLYMARGRKQMALDQLAILGEQFPRSDWTAWGHYVAGRTYYDREEWARAERELLLMADAVPEHPVAATAYLWAAQAQLKLDKYEQAVVSFRRALAREMDEELEPQILFSIAYCMERAGTAPVEVEERYMEVRTRYPLTDYARRADYRLARMALAEGHCEKAVARYEFFLSNWPVTSDQTPQACRDLVRAYVSAGENVRAVILAEVMVSTFGHVDVYWQALPDVLTACQKGGVPEMGLRVLGRALEAAADPQRRRSLLVRQANWLMDMGRYEEAETALAEIGRKVEGIELRERVLLAQARLWMQRDARRGTALCSRAAREAVSEQVRADALKLLAGHYEQAGLHGKAALAYSGMCPVVAEEEPQ